MEKKDQKVSLGNLWKEKTLQASKYIYTEKIMSHQKKCKLKQE